MKIDAHQHFWHYNPDRDSWITEDMQAIRKDFNPDDLLKELKKNEINGSVAIQASPTEAETSFLLGIAERYDFVKGVVGWVDFTHRDVEERLRHYKDTSSKLKGFRHTVQDEPDDNFLLREDFCRGISLLEAFDYTYDILIFPRQLPAAIRFAEKFPDHKLIVDHIAKPDIKNGVVEPWSGQMKVLASYPNVYCKISGMVTEANWKNWTEEDFKPYLDVIFEAFGPERLMFGSDWPVCLIAGTYTRAKQIITRHIKGMNTNTIKGIMGENAVGFYTL